MKKLELNQMENLEGGLASLTSCQKWLMSHGEFTASDACVICSAAGAAAGGAVVGGPAGALTGWAAGAIGALFTC
ncbi:hypothetical protein [Flavobacterium sp.]|jgi:hypothetical protein|uniref:hypothetical protein n=1 Tax=Flavobacterium sp. TaxID=239 RepID=UPI0037BEF426